MAAGETVNLGQLLLQMGLDTTTYYQQLEDARKKALSVGVEIEKALAGGSGMNLHLAPTVDHKNLNELNKHLDKKKTHFQEVQKYYDRNPLTYKADSSQIDEVEEKIDQVNNTPILIQMDEAGLRGVKRQISEIADTKVRVYFDDNSMRYRYAEGSSKGKFAPNPNAPARESVGATLDLTKAIVDLTKVFEDSNKKDDGGGIFGAIGGAVSGIFSDIKTGFFEHFGGAFSEEMARGMSNYIEGKTGKSFYKIGKDAARIGYGRAKQFGEIGAQGLGYEKGLRGVADDVKYVAKAIDDFLTPKKFVKRLQKFEDAVVGTLEDLYVYNDRVAAGKRVKEYVAPSFDTLREGASRAAGVGLRAASQPFRLRKRVNLARSMELAKQLSEIIQVPDIENIDDMKSIAIMSGGVDLQEGGPNTYFARNVLKNVLGPGVATVPVPNEYSNSKEFGGLFETRKKIAELVSKMTGKEVSEDDAKAMPIDRLLNMAVETGYNPDAIRMEATRLAYEKKYPGKKYIFAGTSAGTVSAEEATAIAERGGATNVKGFGATLGLYGLTNTASAKNFRAFVGDMDPLFMGSFGDRIDRSKLSSAQQKMLEGQMKEIPPTMQFAGLLAPSRSTEVIPGAGIAHHLGQFAAEPKFQERLSSFLEGYMGDVPNEFKGKSGTAAFKAYADIYAQFESLSRTFKVLQGDEKALKEVEAGKYSFVTPDKQLRKTYGESQEKADIEYAVNETPSTKRLSGVAKQEIEMFQSIMQDIIDAIKDVETIDTDKIEGAFGKFKQIFGESPVIPGDAIPLNPKEYERLATFNTEMGGSSVTGPLDPFKTTLEEARKAYETGLVQLSLPIQEPVQSKRGTGELLRPLFPIRGNAPLPKEAEVIAESQQKPPPAPYKAPMTEFERRKAAQRQQEMKEASQLGSAIGEGIIKQLGEASDAIAEVIGKAIAEQISLATQQIDFTSTEVDLPEIKPPDISPVEIDDVAKQAGEITKAVEASITPASESFGAGLKEKLINAAAQAGQVLGETAEGIIVSRINALLQRVPGQKGTLEANPRQITTLKDLQPEDVQRLSQLGTEDIMGLAKATGGAISTTARYAAPVVQGVAGALGGSKQQLSIEGINRKVQALRGSVTRAQALLPARADQSQYVTDAVQNILPALAQEIDQAIAQLPAAERMGPEGGAQLANLRSQVSKIEKKVQDLIKNLRKVQELEPASVNEIEQLSIGGTQVAGALPEAEPTTQDYKEQIKSVGKAFSEQLTNARRLGANDPQGAQIAQEIVEAVEDARKAIDDLYADLSDTAKEDVKYAVIAAKGQITKAKKGAKKLIADAKESGIEPQSQVNQGLERPIAQVEQSFSQRVLRALARRNRGGNGEAGIIDPRLLGADVIAGGLRGVAQAGKRTAQSVSDLYQSLSNGITKIPSLLSPFTLISKRKEAALKKSTEMALKRADELTKQGLGDYNKQAKALMVVSGGFTGQRGKTGPTVANRIGRLVGSDFQIDSIQNVASDTTVGSNKFVRFVGQIVAKAIDHNILRGFNPDAVEMAAQGIARQRQTGLPLNFVGYSAGGYVANEARTIAERAGIQSKAVGIGTPSLSFAKPITSNITGADPSKFRTFVHSDDIVGKLTDYGRASVQRLGSGGHNLANYLSNPQFQNTFFNFLGLGKAQPGSNDPAQFAAAGIQPFGGGGGSGGGDGGDKRGLAERFGLTALGQVFQAFKPANLQQAAKTQVASYMQAAKAQMKRMAQDFGEFNPFEVSTKRKDVNIPLGPLQEPLEGFASLVLDSIESMQQMMTFAPKVARALGDVATGIMRNSKLIANLGIGFAVFNTVFKPLLGLLGQFSDAAYDAAMRMETLQKTIKFTSGSAREGQQNFDFVIQDSKRLNTNIEQSLSGFAGISASTRGTSLEGDQTREIFSSLNQASAVYNLSPERQQNAFVALSQMIDKGVVSMEELRGQLSEALPGAMSIAARSMGMGVKEFQAFVASGQLMSEEFIPKFAQQLSAETAAGLAGSANTAQASMNRLNNSILELQVAFGKMVAPARNMGLDVASKGMELLAKNAAILNQAIGFVLFTAFKGIIVSTLKLTAVLLGMPSVIALIKTALSSLLSTLKAAAIQFLAFTAALEALKVIQTAFGDNSNGLKSFADEATSAWEKYTETVHGATKANQGFFESLNNGKSGRSMLENTILGSILPKDLVRMGESALQAPARMVAQTPLGGLFRNLTGGELGSSYEDLIANQMDTQLSRILGQGNTTMSEIYSKMGVNGQGNGEVQRIRDLDQQIAQLQSQRRTLPAGADQQRIQLDEQLKSLSGQRQEAAKPFQMLQANLAREISGYQSALKTVEDEMAQPTISTERRQQLEQQYQQINKQLQSALVLQGKFDDLISTTANSARKLAQEFSRIQAELSSANFNIEMDAASSMQQIAEGLSAGFSGFADGLTEGQAEFERFVANQDQLRAKIRANTAAITEMSQVLQDVSYQQVFDNVGLTQEERMNPEAIRNKASTLGDVPEKAMLEQAADQTEKLQSLRLETANLTTQMTEAQAQAQQQVRDTSRQITEFYRGIFRESQQLALSAKEAKVEVAALNAKAKLQSALTGFSNEFFGEFTDGIINLVDQFFEPMRNSLQAQQQILANDNRLQDTLMQGQQLGQQVFSPNGVPGWSGGGQIQVGAGGQIRTVATGTLPDQEYGASRAGGARRHAGQDLDYGANDSAQSFLGGVVTRMGSDPGGYGNYIDIYNETLGVVERLAEMDNVLVQVGQQIASGQAVGRGTRDTGVIHYEIRTDVNGQRQGGFGYEGTVNPLEFLQSRGIAQRQGNQLIARNGQAIGIAQGEHFEGDGHDHGAMQSGGAGGAPQAPQMPRVQIPGASLNLAGSGGIVGQNSQFQVPARTRTAQTGWGGLSIMGNNAVARTQAQQPQQSSGRRYVPRGGTVRRAERVQSDPDGARAMAATAQRLGLPVDQFAALMSWESAGSLNPNIVGGDNNAYQGLIQFSPENRQRYGIRPNMTIAEQMPAIERYLLDRGFKPGEMDIRGAYSAVLAGNASQRYWNRQDSNGTSVNNAAHRFRSGDHYDRARQFLAASGYTGAASAMVQAQQGGTGGMTPGMPGMALPPGVDPSQINAGMDLARSNAAAESQQILDRLQAQNNLAGIQRRQQINNTRRSIERGSLSLEDTTRQYGRQQTETLASIGPQTAGRELDNSLRQAQQEFDDRTRELQLKIRSAQEGIQDLQGTLQFLREFSQANPGSGLEALIPDTEQAIAKAQTELGNLQGLFDKEKDVFEQRRQFILEEAQRAEQTRKFEVQQSTLGLERNVFDAQAVQLRRNGMGEQAITQEGQLRTREINLDTQGRIRELDEQLRLERLTNEEYARQKALLEQLNSTSLANLQEELRRSREELAFNTQSEVFGSRQAIGQELVSGLNQQGFTTQANRVQAQMQREQVGFDLQSRLRQIDEMARSSGMAAEAVAQLRDNAQQLAEVKLDNINNQVSVMGQVVPAVQQGFQGFFSGILSGTQSVGEAFKGMLESILNNLANLASQLITNELFGGLFGMGNGNNMMGGGGGFLGMLTGKGGGGGGFGGILPGKGAKGGGGGGFLGALLGGGDSGGGGFLGSLFSGVLSLFSEGGEVEPEDHRGYREGYGQISKALKKEGTRSVLAALTPGEIVLNVHQAKRYKEMGGERIFNFAKGGMVPGVSAKPVGMPKAGTNINVNVPVNVSGGNESAVDVPGLQKVIDSRVQETLLREQRPGGTLNRSGKRQ